MINEPFLLKPVLMEKIWGGRKLETVMNKKLPPGKFGESWEASTHPNGISTIASGFLKNTKLDKAIGMYPEEMLGRRIIEKGYKTLPVLIKFIDASDKLSVQVHPDDAYAEQHENDRGKTEMWYILYSEPGAQLIYGLQEGTSRSALNSAISSGTIEKLLRYVDIQKGDILLVPSGTVHAILGGVVLLEIQESSDSTYRLYDWNRPGFDGKPRPLHIEKALEVINFDFRENVTRVRGEKQTFGFVSTLVKSPYFTVKRYNIDKIFQIKENQGSRFNILIVTEGSGIIKWETDDSVQGSLSHGSIPYKKGNTFFVPSACAKFRIKPVKTSEFIDVFLD
ncbi:MAG: mannose-6-phosphate isomerase [Spirochaetes bacterium]|nr:mannose-6-phosphate isomerase [Spirochaetota bacterium]